MASENLRLPIWFNDRLVTFYPGYIDDEHDRQKISEFVVGYIQKKIGVGLNVSATWPTYSKHVIGRLSQMRVHFSLLHNWTPWSSMPLDWTEGVDSIINEALEKAQEEGLIPDDMRWFFSSSYLPHVSPDEPVQSLQASVASESRPIDVRLVTFRIPVPPSEQAPLIQFVVEYILQKYHLKVSAKFRNDYQMVVELLGREDSTARIPVTPEGSNWRDFFASIINEALEAARDAGLLPKGETWIISLPHIWRANTPEEGERSNRSLKGVVASESLWSEDGAAHKIPVLSTDREVSFWIPIPPDQQSGLTDFVVKHNQEKYGLSVSAEFMFPNGLIPQNQMLVRTSLLWDWKAPSPMPSDRAKFIDYIINETLRAALREGLLPKGEWWTISVPGAWGFSPVEPVPGPLPPVASEGSDPRIDMIIVLDVTFKIRLSKQQQQDLAKFLVTYVKGHLHLSIKVEFEYPGLIAIKMKVTLVGRGDSLRSAHRVIDEGLKQAAKEGLLPEGESWTITIRFGPHPLLKDGEGQH